MPQFKVATQRFQLESSDVVRCAQDLLPDPVREHYVVVEGRRFPPKQVLACLTGLDRADFTTHQARRILRRLGFVAGRAGSPAPAPEGAGGGSRQANAFRPYVGKWIALASPTEVLVAADRPEDVLAWLSRHDRRADYGMFRVPERRAESEGAAPA
jgi:hypothetical protein